MDASRPTPSFCVDLTVSMNSPTDSMVRMCGAFGAMSISISGLSSRQSHLGLLICRLQTGHFQFEGAIPYLFRPIPQILKQNFCAIDIMVFLLVPRFDICLEEMPNLLSCIQWSKRYHLFFAHQIPAPVWLVGTGARTKLLGQPNTSWPRSSIGWEVHILKHLQ